MNDRPLTSKITAYESPKLSYVGALSDLTSGGSGHKSEGSKSKKKKKSSSYKPWTCMWDLACLPAFAEQKAWFLFYDLLEQRRAIQSERQLQHSITTNCSSQRYQHISANSTEWTVPCTWRSRNVGTSIFWNMRKVWFSGLTLSKQVEMPFATWVRKNLLHKIKASAST